MIKGFNRRVVIMKDTGSDCFDEAYFIIKENAYGKHRSGKSPMEEAKRIIKEMSSGQSKKKASGSLIAPIAFFLLGCIFGMIVF